MASNMEWRSATEIAIALGVSTQAIRQRAKRQDWERRTANTGKAKTLFRVDLEELLTGQYGHHKDIEGTPPSRPDDKAVEELRQALSEARQEVSGLGSKVGVGEAGGRLRSSERRHGQPTRRP